MSRHATSLALAALIGLSATAIAARQRPPQENLSGYLPPGDARALVIRNCTGCHDLRGTLQLRKPREGWEAIVLDMGARGAPLELDHIDPMVAYLSGAFAPGLPPFVDVNADSRDTLTKIPGVTGEVADRLMAARSKAPLTSHDQVQAALGLDAQAFEKVRRFLYVKAAK